MAGSVYGNRFVVSTWGESHGAGVGAVVDGCPAGLLLDEGVIQGYLDRRRPGQTIYSTPRREADEVEILSGVFEGKTTGTPISLLVRNTSQRSSDYSEIASYYRPGHADYTFHQKYGFRDYRGGGRSSGRETIGRVAAGAIALEILSQLGIRVTAYTRSIGSFEIQQPDLESIGKSPLRMPDLEISRQAEEYLQQMIREKDSIGGVVECIVSGVPAGIGEPVFQKLDASLAKGIFSIGAVKGVEIGEGMAAAKLNGSQNNDAFYLRPDGSIGKKTNHAGGILGGISDGSDLIIRAAFKPTPSIFQEQETISLNKEEISISIRGRHDPVIMPRAVVVVESMAAITLVDLMFSAMTSQMDKIKDFFA